MFFNPIALMEANLRRAKETGEIPQSLREVLFQQFVSTSGNERSAKKLKKIQRSLQNQPAKKKSIFMLKLPSASRINQVGLQNNAPQLLV